MKKIIIYFTIFFSTICACGYIATHCKSNVEYITENGHCIQVVEIQNQKYIVQRTFLHTNYVPFFDGYTVDKEKPGVSFEIK